MNELILDTSVYSGFKLGVARALTPLRAAHEIHVPLIVLAELLAGFAAGTRAERNRDDLTRFMASPRVHLLVPDEKTAQHYAAIYADLRRGGTPIPTNDMWIAALAIQHRLPLLSFDSHFASVPKIELIASK